ncbi:MAG: bacillithiol biosynthesis cysteine-adding enzyme BshC [Chitinophagaceae bacterium]|nr:bacillithiol biosynthesis cysteine-adding enzyme BshC [Chitinophagaceae bacterium]
MDCTATYLSYSKTNQFSSLVNDYLEQSPNIKDFYEHPVSVEGIKQAVLSRKGFNTDRRLLVRTIKKIYQSTTLSPLQEKNLDALASENTFTICTAHQPNIFTGYLYFIYKIIHAIKLADDLNIQLPAYRFVPVFYMGSEDNDLDELSQVNLNGVKLSWETGQSGAVGRMKVDKKLLQLTGFIEGQLGVEPYGKEVVDILKNCYKEGLSVAEATFSLINTLFAEYGLLVLLPDNADLKQKMQKVFEDDLLKHKAYEIVSETGKALEDQYKVQVNPREINLFYLEENSRERIERNNGSFHVLNSTQHFKTDEILQLLQSHPDRFSPNVVLRGLYQEMILPGVAFIGGGSEIAYWLELKKLFNYYNVPYPVLVLRNSFLILNSEQREKIEQMGFSVEDMFQPDAELLNQLVKRESENKLTLLDEKAAIQKIYRELSEKAGAIDKTLLQYIAALETEALKGIDNLEKKMLRAEKRKYETQQRQLQKIKAELFPGDGLQERIDNFMPWYAKLGKKFLEDLYTHSPALEQQFTVLEYH